jgi:hypothetical protein
MTAKLYEMLCKKFPPMPSGRERVSTYCDNERVHLKLIDKTFLDSNVVLDSKIVKDIASRLFDVSFRFYPRQEEGDIVFFSPKGIDDYSLKYTGHSIEILQRPGEFPVLTFSTGNRGCACLDSKQRYKYFHFGVCLNDTLLERAKVL